MSAKKKAVAKKNPSAKNKPLTKTENVIKISPFYPGEAITTFKNISPKTVPKNQEVELTIDITWVKTAYPEVQVSGVSVDFIQKDSTEIFPRRAKRTAIKSLDMQAKKMKLRVVNVFEQPGEYYARVTFGGHWEILDCVYGSDSAAVAIKVS
jgi:hypothetical protein